MSRYPIAFLIFLLAPISSADLFDLSEDKLDERATTILTGKVQRIFTRTENKEAPGGIYQYTYYAAELFVESVEKGERIETGDLVYVRMYRSQWVGQGFEPPGHNGHHPLPIRGMSATVFLKRGTDGGYDVVLPNGLVKK